MSVKTMLPLIGVGSAFAILGLCAARRPAKPAFDGGPELREHRMPSGVHRRVSLDEADGSELAASVPALTSDFWDAPPVSDSAPESYGRPPSEVEVYDALDPEDLGAEWLTRATEAPVNGGLGAFDLDDPAEIPADSISMVSEASRRAAAVDLDELDESSERPADSQV